MTATPETPPSPRRRALAPGLGGRGAGVSAGVGAGAGVHPYLSPHYNAYTQSFVRYAKRRRLTPWCAVLPGASCGRRWGGGGLLGISLLVVLMQTAWTLAIYKTTATSAQLV